MLFEATNRGDYELLEGVDCERDLGEPRQRMEAGGTIPLNDQHILLHIHLLA